jgi:hypothetical protein
MSLPKSWDLWFLLTWRKILLVLAAWVACVVLHNLVYALFRRYFGAKGDEPFFFLLAVVVIPLYVLVALVYTAVRMLSHQH